MFYLKIKIESFIRIGPSQGQVCQRFHHGSKNWGHLQRYVKYAGVHRTRDCTKTMDQDPLSYNYGEKHTANFLSVNIIKQS